ncbi:hypothetical protein FRC01_014402 [Tulasnella sp. 417]|nr:hypothetical protein FRC01_014402 [Tulasnella sp. 417]
MASGALSSYCPLNPSPTPPRSFGFHNLASFPHDLGWIPRDSISKEPVFIDRLPIELLERLISLGVKGNNGLLEVERVYMWRRVSRKWKNVIDNCPSLWSSIYTSKGTKHVRTQLEKSKGAPIDILIQISFLPPQDDDWIRLLVENAHRWRSIWAIHVFNKLVAQLGSSPLMMDKIRIQGECIPRDCKLFNLVRPNLRKLDLLFVTIPDNLDPTLGLEELCFNDIKEQREDGTTHKLPISKIRQFLQANPNLRRLGLQDLPTASPNDGGLQAVKLPKLEEATTSGSQVLHLFRAEHCHWVRFTVGCIKENPPLRAWATLGHTLRRVERLKIVVRDACLSIRELAGPDKVEVFLDVSAARGKDRRNLVYSMLKGILDEAEKDAQISARVELALFATRESGSESDPNLEVLELLQTPVSHSSSRQTCWRMPNLDTIRMREPGLLYHHLRAFIQARSNCDGIQPAGPIAGIFIQSDIDNDKNFKEVLEHEREDNAHVIEVLPAQLATQEHLFINRLPIELLERLIAFGVEDDTGLLEVERVRMWRRVSRKWKNVIDNCPSLWSSIRTRKGIKHVRAQLAKSKRAPIDILFQVSRTPSQDDDWIRLLVENAHRWRSILFVNYFNKVVAQLGSPPLRMDTVKIQCTNILRDCKLFNPVRPTLRKLDLLVVTIPHNFDPTLGLEELDLTDIMERREDGTTRKPPISRFHQFLQANPNLRRLKLHDHLAHSPNDRDLRSVDLPKLREVAISGSQVLHLFRAENCRAAQFTVRSIRDNPPLSAWTTLAHTLRRVQRFKIMVNDTWLWVGDVGGSYRVGVRLDVTAAIHEERQNLVYSMLKGILDEAEKDAQISACVELELFATRESGSDSDLNLEVLDLLQTPVSRSSSRQTRWRIPNLDTISMLEPGLSYNRLRAFIQARSNSAGIQPAGPITGIFIQSGKYNGWNFKEALDEVLS